MATFSLNINGNLQTIEAEPGMPLLWVLRDLLNLTGTKFGCGIGVCGACTVLIDGEATRSCIAPVSENEGKTITTIEGLSKDGAHAIQQAWIAESVSQCGYCQTGAIMATAALDSWRLYSRRPYNFRCSHKCHCSNLNASDNTWGCQRPSRPKRYEFPWCLCSGKE